MAKPTLTMRRLGRQLALLRAAAGMTAEQVAKTEAINRRSLANLEDGVIKVRWPTCKSLAEIYGADARTVNDIVEMAKNADAKGWSDKPSTLGTSAFSMFRELEPEASSIHIFDAEAVTGLLQTPAYMATVMSANPDAEENDIPDAVKARLERQTNVFGRNPRPRVQVVMTEGALMRRVGGKQVHDEQLRHLQESPAEVRVILNKAGAYHPMNGSFTLLEFDNELDPPTVYLESFNRCEYIEDRLSIEGYRKVFDSLVTSSVELERFLK